MIDLEDLSTIYYFVAADSQNSRKKRIYKYTIKNNSVAVVTDGSACLVLAILARKAMPVMEGSFDI